MANTDVKNILISGIETSAASVLIRAVEYDKSKRYQSALVCYQEGIQLLLDVSKNITDDNKKKDLRSRVTQYIERAERVKVLLEKEKDAGTYHEQIQIAPNSTGYSYEQVFKRYLDSEVTTVEIEDPYIRNTHQVCNLLRFCELLLKCCPNLKAINLTTGTDIHQQEAEGQKKRLNQLSSSLSKFNVKLSICFSSTLHDREIRLDNGWVIKIGRGLDYFKPTDHNFDVGFCDLSFRKCHETTIDIFHRKFIRKNSNEL